MTIFGRIFNALRKRAKEKCPGYRNLIDVIFHDETNIVKTRAASQAKRRLENSIARNRQCKSRSQSPVTPIPAEIPADVEEYAKSFFLSSYILRGDGIPGHLSCLARLLTRGQLDVALQTALVAVGTAGLSFMKSSPQLEVAARKSYSLAISQINEALQDPTRVTKDDILAAIVTLGVYEVISCDSQQSMQAWYNHVLGAMALVQLRGNQQLEHEIGLELFLHLRTQIMVACIQRGEEVPELMQRLMRESQRFRSHDQIQASVLGDIIAKLCSVRALIRPSQGLNWQGSVGACLGIDEQLRAWSVYLRFRGEYTHVGIWLASEEVYDNQYHVYKDLYIAWLWNLYRVAKIITHETILDVLKLEIVKSKQLSTGFPSDFIRQYERSLSELRQASSEIFSSVPYHLNFHDQDNTPPRPVNGLLLIWNLYAAARLEIRAGPARHWAMRRLQHIAHTMGIKQAAALACVLKKRSIWEAEERKSFESGRYSDGSAVDMDDIYSPLTKQRYLTDLPMESAE
ncbi:hypothetical protein PT974_06359 [Cladobotryum mycophilum]|uniref:Uncharacterized protein n=1 Tax=Cladobotryum mycophilum TaxID=491253 RepID=A0ABR0SL96_9HYPO